jgi:hypothetical protein
MNMGVFWSAVVIALSIAVLAGIGAWSVSNPEPDSHFSCPNGHASCKWR